MSGLFVGQKKKQIQRYDWSDHLSIKLTEKGLTSCHMVSTRQMDIIKYYIFLWYVLIDTQLWLFMKKKICFSYPYPSAMTVMQTECGHSYEALLINIFHAILNWSE